MSAPLTTFGELKEQVAGFMHRAPGDFVIGSVDILSKAVYRARLYAQLRQNFEELRCAVTIPSMSITSGASLSTAVMYGTTTPVDVKTIESAYIAVGTTLIPIDTEAKFANRRRLKEVFKSMGPARDVVAYSPTTVGAYRLVQQGSQVMLTPTDSALVGSTFDLHCDAVKWADEYEDDNSHDFFTDYGETFMLFRSIFELNFYLKEDERVQVSAQVLQDAWEAFLAWDASRVLATTSDFNLS